MIVARKDLFKWSEMYRPQTVGDCILPAPLKAKFMDFVRQGEFPNLILTGPSGIGKTTVALAMCQEIGCDVLFIKASEESGIDTLRTKIRNYASTVSFSGKKKAIIFDEADYLRAESTQPALRGFMDEFGKNCLFIFTCNYENKITVHVQSRCTVINFKLLKEDRPQMAALFNTLLQNILTENNIPFNPSVVSQLLIRYFPDYRRVLNELQFYSASGAIDDGILAAVSHTNMKPLIEAMRERNWQKMSQWVTESTDANDAGIYDTLWSALRAETKDLPQLVILLADYGSKTGAASAELLLRACLSEIMASCKFGTS